jgi:integrase
VRGSVRKPRTPGGSWGYRIDLGEDEVGKRVQKQVAGFPTKKAAQAALSDALSAFQRGSYIAPSRQTLREFLEVWLEGVRSEVAITAWTSYRDAVNRYVLPYLGSRRLIEITPLELKAWHSKLLASGRVDGGPLSPRTVQIAHRVLHRALADAKRWNVIHTNPAGDVRSPKVVRKEMQVWTSTDAAKFLAATAEDRLFALWVVALHTGMRRGELAGLRWKDVKLDSATLTVNQQRTVAHYQVIVAEPKAKSQRQLHLAPATVAALQVHRQRQRLERLAVGPGWENTGYVFVDELGRPYHPQRLRPMFEKACIAVGVPAIRLHDLRHTMASLALEAGVHPKVVQEQLGHSGIDITLDIYSHVPQAVKRSAAEQIAGLFQVSVDG